MSYLFYIPLGFACFQLVNVLLNWLFKQRLTRDEAHGSELISVLIPARNEEQNIQTLLAHLTATDDLHMEVLVYDDQSTDGTASVVEQFAKRDSRVRLIAGESLNEGWLGKNHACHILSQHAKGELLLFIDADVAIFGSIVRDSAAYMKRKRLSLLSIFPVQVQKSMGEKATVPIMSYILLTLLPLILVRVSPFSSHSAANGQFMLFDGEEYRRLQPHKLFKRQPVEDIAIARFYKNLGLTIACLIGDERLTCRMYLGYKEALAGFSKNIFMFFGGSPVLSFTFWLMVASGIALMVAGSGLLSIILLGVELLTLLLYASVTGQSRLTAILLFPCHLFFMVHVMLASLAAKVNKQLIWKERSIYR